MLVRFQKHTACCRDDTRIAQSLFISNAALGHDDVFMIGLDGQELVSITNLQCCFVSKKTDTPWAW